MKGKKVKGKKVKESKSSEPPHHSFYAEGLSIFSETYLHFRDGICRKVQRYDYEVRAHRLTDNYICRNVSIPIERL